MTRASGSGTPRQRRVLALAFIVLGLIGMVAAFALTLDKLAILADPNAALSCNVNDLVGCSTNLNSAQGEVFGFPNSLLGLVFWSAIITMGVMLLAGSLVARWVWLCVLAGASAALALVVWFIGQSIFVLNVLCPWCLVTWAVTIPFFLIVFVHALRSGALPAPQSVRRAARAVFSWIPLLTLSCYLVVAALAQWQLNIIAALFG